MRTTLSHQAGLAAYQSQLQTQRVQDAVARVTESRKSPDATAEHAGGFRLKLGKLQVSLFQNNPSARNAMDTAMDALRAMEEQSWRAEMDVAALKQKIAAPVPATRTSQELAPTATPTKRQRNTAANAYSSAETAHTYAAARPGTLIGVY